MTQPFPEKQFPITPPQIGQNNLFRVIQDFARRLLNLERRIGSVSPGWITVGSGGGAPAYATGMSDANTGAGYRTRFCKHNGWVIVVVQVTKGATATPIFTLPDSSYIPTVPVWAPLAGPAAAANQMFVVNTAGVVGFGASALANATYYGFAAYPVGI